MPIHAPLQDRSRRTFEAILDATETLLARRPFEEISIAEIVLKAGSSTGSFYARFPAKDALLPALYVAALAGRSIEWHGKRFETGAGGALNSFSTRR